MASYTSTFASRIRKAVRAVGIGVASSASQLDSACPTITSGTGAPSATAANGSLYLRTDATDNDDSLYVRVGGAWVVHYGKTA